MKALNLSIKVGEFMRNFDPDAPDDISSSAITPTTSMSKKRKGKKGKKNPSTPLSSSGPSTDSSEVTPHLPQGNSSTSPLSPMSEMRRAGNILTHEGDVSKLRETLTKRHSPTPPAKDLASSYIEKATDLLSTFSSNEVQTLDVKFRRDRGPTKTMRMLMKENDARKDLLKKSLETEGGNTGNISSLIMGKQSINVGEHLGSPRQVSQQATQQEQRPTPVEEGRAEPDAKVEAAAAAAAIEVGGSEEGQQSSL